MGFLYFFILSKFEDFIEPISNLKIYFKENQKIISNELQIYIYFSFFQNLISNEKGGAISIFSNSDVVIEKCNFFNIITTNSSNGAIFILIFKNLII